MSEVIMILAVGFVCMSSFLMGAKVGQTVARGDRVETPTVNPVKLVQEHEARKEAEREQKRLDVIMQNIDNYDGTGFGQEDVPGR